MKPKQTGAKFIAVEKGQIESKSVFDLLANSDFQLEREKALFVRISRNIVKRRKR